MARISIDKNISYDEDRKTFYVKLYYGVVNGKPKTETKTAKTEAEARKILRTFLVKKDNDEVVLPKETRLCDLLENWMNNVIIPLKEETTAFNYAHIIKKHINPYLGDRPIQKIKPGEIQKYYAYKLSPEGGNLSLNTLRRHHNLLKTAFRFAVKQEDIASSPVEKVIPPTEDYGEKKPYTPRQVAELLEQVVGTNLELVVNLAVYCGLRREEICGLSWDNVDFENHRLLVSEVLTTAGSKMVSKKPKTKKSRRYITFPDAILLQLLREKKNQEQNKELFKQDWVESGKVIVKANGESYSPNSISEMFARFVKKLPLPKITLHVLRHTFASIANSSGETLFDISNALGHANTSVTSTIYMHMLEATNTTVVQAVADKISDAAEEIRKERENTSEKHPIEISV